MKELYFVDREHNVYDKNGNVIGKVGRGFIVDRTRSDLIQNGEYIGKFINIDDISKIKEYTDIVSKKNLEDLVSEGVNTVTKEENGIIKNYIVIDDVIYDDNNSYLNFNEKMKSVLMKWLDDPIKSEEVSNMSPDKLREALIDAVKGDYKEYYFDDSNKVDKDDERARLAGERASYVDGRVNSELGIIENGPDDVHDYSVVEERENGYEVVTPTVTSTGINSSSVVSSGGNEEYSEPTQNEEEVQEREFGTGVFYMDGVGNVYDSDGNLVPGVDPNAIMTDENNELWYGNEKVGVYGGTLDDLAVSMENTRDKSSVRTLKKEDNAGFGNVGIIMVVLIVLNAIAAFVSLLLLD